MQLKSVVRSIPIMFLDICTLFDSFSHFKFSLCPNCSMIKRLRKIWLSPIPSVTSSRHLASDILTFKHSDSLELFTDTSALEGCKYFRGLLLVRLGRIKPCDWIRIYNAALDGCNSCCIHSHTLGI